MSDDRITQLEIRFSHQDDFLEQLNKLVIEQQKTIERITRELLELRMGVEGLNENAPGALSGSDKPPHY